MRLLVVTALKDPHVSSERERRVGWERKLVSKYPMSATPTSERAFRFVRFFKIRWLTTTIEV